MKSNGCDFCAELHSKHSYFNSVYRKFLPNRFIARTRHFSIIPSIGQISLGHVLIISNRHMTASAQLSIDEFRELFVLTKNFRNLIASQFAKETVIFEHGILSAGSSRNCGVDHLHIHIVPVKETTRFDRQLANIISMNKIGSMQELREFSSKDDPYLYVSTSETRHLARVDKALPSQFMRIALCDFLGKTEWDWRKAGIEKTLVQTYELFRTLGPDIERYVSMDKVAA